MCGSPTPFPPSPTNSATGSSFEGVAYEFENPLGRVPSLVVGYTSFEQDGRFSTVGSGNSFVVQEASASTVTIGNAQNQFFYLRLILE